MEGKLKEKYYSRGITLKQARELAKKDRELIDQGIDPRKYWKEQEAKRLAELKAQEIAKQNTFRHVAEKAYEYYSGMGKRTGEGGRRKFSFLKNHVFPRIGDKLIQDITPRDIADIIIPLYGTYSSAVNKIKLYIKQVYEFALNHEEEYGLTEIPFNQRFQILRKDAQRHRKESKNYGSVSFIQVPELINRAYASST